MNTLVIRQRVQSTFQQMLLTNWSHCEVYKKIILGLLSVFKGAFSSCYQVVLYYLKFSYWKFIIFKYSTESNSVLISQLLNGFLITYYFLNFNFLDFDCSFNY